MLGAAAWAMGCMPSADLSEYSRGGAGLDDEQASPTPDDPEGDAPGGGSGSPSGGDQAPPDTLAPGEAPADGVDPGSLISAGVTGTDGGVTVAADAGTLDAGVSPCAAGELLGADGHCHFFEPLPLSWDDARARCRTRGPTWDLTVIRSPGESTFLAAQLTFEVWIGASDTTSETSWLWVTDATPFWVGTGTGSAVGGAYTNWNVTEPNGGITTNCARALPNAFGSPTPNAPWADLVCTELRGSVCEEHGVP
jgi:lectin-like protein